MRLVFPGASRFGLERLGLARNTRVQAGNGCLEIQEATFEGNELGARELGELLGEGAVLGR